MSIVKEKDGSFNLDPCATEDNAKCRKFFTAADDDLKQSWGDIAKAMAEQWCKEQ